MTATTATKAKPAGERAAKAAVFIDGEAGTTGLEIRRRLAGVAGLDVKSIAADKRKDEAARLALMGEADLVVLCLPDQAAREAVALLGSLGDGAPKVVDASTAHRVAEGWVYGFPEMDCRPGGGRRQGERRLQSGLLSDRGHRAPAPARRGRTDPRRLSRHRQRRQRLQRRRPDDDRGLRGRPRPGLRALRRSTWSTSTCRSCRSTPGSRGGRSSCRRSATSGRACW